jgi:site-specific DNA recombinase
MTATTGAQMIRACGYLRVSTDEQVTKGWNLEEDRRLIGERADALGSQMVAIFDDGGLQGDDPDRPGLLAMLSRLDEFDVIILRSLDRLSRDTYLFALATRAIRAAGVQVSDFDRMIDLDTPEGELATNVLAAIHRFEKRQIGVRVKQALDGRARAGLPGGGPRAYGYQRVDGKLVPDPLERVVVLRIFESADHGMSQRAIAKMFLAEGIRSRDGGAFAQSSVGQMLGNVLYCGRIKHRDQILSGQHEAIVPLDLWERVNAARASKPRRTGGRPVSGLHLLTKGILRCGRCGSAMVAARPGHDAYACFGRRRYGKAFCDRSAVPRALIDETILRELTLRYIDFDESSRRWAAEWDAKLAAARDAVSRRESEQAKVSDNLSRIRRDYVDGAITAAEWHELREELAAELQGATAAAERAREHAEQVAADRVLLDAQEAILRWLAALKEAVANDVDQAPDLDSLRTTIRQLFESVELVGPDKPFGSGPYGDGYLSAHDPRVGEDRLFLKLHSEAFDFERLEISGFDDGWEPRKVPLPVETDRLTLECL